MLFRAFQPQTTGQIKKVTSSERSAQDDDFAGVLKKNIPNKLALMGRSPTIVFTVLATNDGCPTSPISCGV
jgi:hypothetical protein